jgi:hypothetical protein
MKKTIVAVSVIIIFFSHAAHALTEVTSLGNTETVLVTGAADSIRNPALLPYETPTFSVFTAGLYRYYSKGDITGSGNFGAASMTINSADVKSTAFSALVGCVKRSGQNGFGFAFTSSGDPQYAKTTRDSHITTSTPATIDEDDKERMINPAAVISWGIQTGGNSSFGIRFTGGMRRTQRSYEQNTSAPTYQKTESTKQLLFGELAVGFFTQSGGFEAGAMITTGRQGKYQEKHSFKATALPSEITKKTSSKYIIDEPPQFELGIVSPIAEKLRCSFEFTSALPMSSTYDTYEYNEGTSTVESKSKETDNRYEFTGKAGLIYKSSDTLTVMGGLIGILIGKKMNIKSGAETNETHKIYAYGVCMGADFNISPQTTIGISTTFARINLKGTHSNPMNNENSKMKLHIYQGDVAAAAMFIF